MYKFIIYLFTLFLNSSVIAQTGDKPDLKNSKYDSLYIYNYAHKLCLYIPFTVKEMKFGIVNNKEKNSLMYYPNQNLRIGLGFNYKAQGLAINFTFPFLSNDDARFGQTKSLDLQYNIYGRKIIADANFQVYKGFYVQNPGTYNPAFDGRGAYPQRPDVRTVAFGSTCYYSFNNKKFSYRAAFTQTEWQKKSAGSFLLGGYLSFFGMAADSNLIGYEYKTHFNKDSYLISCSSLSTGMAFGYIYTFVIKRHFFVTLSLVPGLGLQSTNSVTANERQIKEDSKLAFNTQARFALGYNHPTWYIGFSAISNNVTLNNSNNSSITYGYGNFKFFIGKRFTIKPRLKSYQKV